METNKLQKRNIVVAGYSLPVEVVLGEERFYNAAAELLNKKVKDYELEYSKTPPAKIFAMAAYDVIVCLMRYCDPLEATEWMQEFEAKNEQSEENL